MSHTAIIHEFGAVVIDVNDLERESFFWGEMLGQKPGQPRSGGDWITVGMLDDKAQLVLQRVPEPKANKDRIHLDFLVQDVDTVISQIIDLGGSQISEPRIGGGVTMADPEGKEFCIGAFRRNEEGQRVPLE